MRWRGWSSLAAALGWLVLAAWSCVRADAWVLGAMGLASAVFIVDAIDAFATPRASL